MRPGPNRWPGYWAASSRPSFWHRFFGVILLTSMLVYLARMVRLLVQGRKQGRTLLQPDLRVRFAAADPPRPQGLLEDVALVLRPGAEAGLRSLVLLGEDRLLGRDRRHRDHRLDRPGAVVPQLLLPDRCRALP